MELKIESLTHTLEKLRFQDETVLSCSLQKKKSMSFFKILYYPMEIFVAFDFLSQCIEYWKYFRNVYTFAHYQGVLNKKEIQLNLSKIFSIFTFKRK